MNSVRDNLNMGEGPPFAQAVIDAVNTLDPGQAATVSVKFDGSNVRFTFSIPRGNDGGQGEPGHPGEVTNATLADMETMRAAYNALVLGLRRP